MATNPVLHDLGFGPDDRVVILHADDLGLCQSGMDAFADLIDFGLVTSGSIMVPCPWFPLVAGYARAHPDCDLGVHLTLNAEWDNLRWGPLSTRDPESGLIDSEGYFPRTIEEVQTRSTPEAVSTELQAQVKRAQAAGIDVTHVDTHMGTVLHPRFAGAYIQVALGNGLPAMMQRLDESNLPKDVPPEMAARAVGLSKQLEAQGMPLMDKVGMLPFSRPDERMAQAKALLGALPAGLTHFFIHAAKDTPELRALTPDWRSRVADYQVFTSEEFRDFARDAGLQFLGYRVLRDWLRKRLAAATRS